MELVKDRCTVLPDFWEQGHFFFVTPKTYDEASIKAKWDEAKKAFFNVLISKCADMQIWDAASIENTFKTLATEKNIKVGELQMIFRIMLVGSKMGPQVFAIAETIGKEETIGRISHVIELF